MIMYIYMYIYICIYIYIYIYTHMLAWNMRIEGVNRYGVNMFSNSVLEFGYRKEYIENENMHAWGT